MYSTPIPLLLLIASIIATINSVVEGRNFIHTPEEMRLTSEIVIPQRPCVSGEVPILVHTAAQSAGKYYRRRAVIRRTWAREVADHGMRVIFVIGLPKDPTEQRKLQQEADQFGDLLQFNFNEHYFNITLKAIAELHWAYRFCNESRFMIRVDDDALLNVPELAKVLVGEELKSGLTGQIEITEAHREPNHKWYMPPKYYDRDEYVFMKVNSI